MSCPPLESLWVALEERDPAAVAHLKACPLCSARIESHRQLEKDLTRLVDSPPPPDFVSRVMARVEAAPLPWTREALIGGGILAVAMVLVALVIPSESLRVDAPGHKLWALFQAWSQALEVLTSGASVAVLAGMVALLAVSAFGVKTLVRAPARGA